MKKFFLYVILIGVFLVSPLKTKAQTISITQDDWSGGSGQTTWSDETKFNSEEGEGLYTSNGLRMKINADTVVGQDNFENITAHGANPKNNSLNYPYSSFYDGNKFFVADEYNHRVLVYNSLPATNGAAADVVIGQNDFTTGTSGTSATKLNYPRSVYSDGTKLFILDSGNNRILIYNTIPTTNGAAADVVIGQTDFVTNSWGASETKFCYPRGIHLDGTKLFIADSGNNRILIYNSIPNTNGAAADVVIGQVGFTGRASGTSNTNLNGPMDIYSYGNKLFVVDEYNHRVLVYNSIPTTNGVAADVVIGQTDFITKTSGTTSTKLNYPYGISSDGVKLFVNDNYNNRVLIYNTIPTTNGAAADVVIGQTSFTTRTSGVSNTKLYYPSDVNFGGGKLFIADRGSNRILVYNSIPTTNGVAADVVIGQSDFISGESNSGVVNAGGFCDQIASVVVNGKLITSDSCNNRVLIFNSVPTANGAAADVVIGQTNFSGSAYGVSATQLRYPTGLYSDGTKLFIADEYNHRVLIYNSIPTTNGAAADVVIGQTDFVTQTLGTSATKLNYPTSVKLINNKLFIVDSCNNRILIYNSIPTTNGAAADVVIGQADFTSSGSAVTASNFNYPYSLSSDGNKLVVADAYNSRILVYNSIPTANGVAADVVIGQDNFTSRETDATSTRLYYPHGAYLEGGKLYVVDTYNYRILVYNSIPTTNGVAADMVIGQSDFEASSRITNGKMNFYDFYTLNFANNKLFVSDYLNNRLLIFNQEEVSSSLTSSTFTSETDQDWGPITWQADTPDNTEVEVSVSIDGGAWNKVTNNQAYIGRGKTMSYKVTLISQDGLSTPTFQSISFGQAAKDDSGIITTLKNIFGNSDKLKLKNNQVIKSQSKTPALRGEEPKLKNGKIEVYLNNELNKTISINDQGYWNDKLKLKDKSYSITFKYLDEFNTLLKTERIKLKVDSEKPTFKEKINKNQNLKRGQKITFTAKDEGLGIDYYKIKLLNDKGHVLKPFKKQTKDYYIVPANLKDGNYTLVIKAYDEAKNYVQMKIDLRVGR